MANRRRPKPHQRTLRRKSRNTTDGRIDHLEVAGVVAHQSAGGHFIVALDVGPEVRATVCGRMRRYRVRVLPGDRVCVALSPYYWTHGLIVHRTLASRS